MTGLILLFSTSDWISLITAIAALITAIVTLITVNEVRKQRQRSYHPDLDIANIEFYVYRYDKDEENDEPEDLINLYYTKDKLDENAKITGYNELLIDLSNTGFGAAKEVIWEWSFDFVSAKRVIGLSKEEFEYHVNDNEYYIKVPDLKVDWVVMLDEDNETDYFNFVLPYSIENRKNTLRIPNYFIDLFWLYKSKGVVKETYDDDLDFPPLKLTMTYLNIDGKKFEKKFNIYLRYSYISHPFNVKKDLGKFKFEIMKIK